MEDAGWTLVIVAACGGFAGLVAAILIAFFLYFVEGG